MAREDTGFVRHRMTGFHHADGGMGCGRLLGRLAVLVFRHRQPAADAVAEQGFHRAAHRRGGFARGDDEDAAIAAQVVGQRTRRIMEGGVGDGQDVAATPENVLHGGKGIDRIERGVQHCEDRAALGRVRLEYGGVEAGHAVLSLTRQETIQLLD